MWQHGRAAHEQSLEHMHFLAKDRSNNVAPSSNHRAPPDERVFDQGMRAHLRTLEQRRALDAYALTHDASLPHYHAWPEHRARAHHSVRMKHHIAAHLICERAQ